MIYLKTTPVGIDKAIQVYQKSLYSFIQSYWSLSEEQILSFGRIHNISGDKEIYRWYDGSYKTFDMGLERNYAVQFFFIAEDESVYNVIFENKTSLYMYVNLQIVKPDISHRADEEVRMDIFKHFKPMESFGGFSAFNIFNSKMDIQPYHAFRVILNIKYQ